jgi:hypothetical protein
MNRRKFLNLALAVPALAAVGCYKRVDTAAGLGAEIRTIALPTFRNPSLRYKVEQRFTDAVTRELLRRARRLRVVSSPEDADAVLTGEIKDLRSGGALLDNTGRTRVFEVVVVVGVTFRDRRHNKILFDDQRLVWRGEYELASEPESFFNEEDPALDRIARDFAASLVSTITNGGF